MATGRGRGAAAAGAEGEVVGRKGPLRVSEGTLVEWGRAIGAQVVPPLWIALYGELGTGKSVFARAVCEGAGVSGRIPSPSFTLMNVYRSPRGFPLIHVDLYRIRRAGELDGLGWGDLVTTSRGIVLVEWADRAAGRLPEDRWDITLEHEAEAALRRLWTVPVGMPARLPPFPAPTQAAD